MSDAPQWQPIETAPKDGTIILIGGRYTDEWFAETARWDAARMQWMDRQYEMPIWEQWATHWHPLPAPPKEGALPPPARRPR